jgi:hypothetical protein
MARPRKAPPVFRLEIEYTPASESDANCAISALALMYRHVMLRRRSALAAIRHAEALPATTNP